MRILYPEEVNKECDMIATYIVRMTECGPVFSNDAPDDIEQRYEALIAKMHEIDRKSA